MTLNEPEILLRGVLDACADCDTCRFLMEEDCLFFPELYRLYDKEKNAGIPAHPTDLHNLSQLCTLCGLCPCSNIRANIIRGKTEQVQKQGLPLGIRLLADVQSFGRWGSLAPRLFNAILSIAPIERTIKKIIGIHPHRKLPRIARESFFSWADRKGLNQKPKQGPAATYFAGCSAGYIFPEVGQAAVAVLAQNGISTYIPSQECCGMPTLLEGNSHATLQRVQSNMEIFLNAGRDEHEIVCSCPTCGYFLKILLSENAFYSQACQKSINAGKDEILVPDRTAGNKKFIRLKKSMYAKLLKDDGYFSSLDPLARIAFSEKVSDMGEYLNRLHRQKKLNTRFGKLGGRMVYFAPCHQREQAIGSPYEKLLALIPGLRIKTVGGAMDCCGMGGSLGFKKGFHEAALNLGKPLMRKIKAANPDAVITDCLSCRLQFQQMLAFPVFHPLEIIMRAYEASRTESESIL